MEAASKYVFHAAHFSRNALQFQNLFLFDLFKHLQSRNTKAASGRPRVTARRSLTMKNPAQVVKQQCSPATTGAANADL